jgi:predicted GNAT family acetyltransferase
VSASGFVTDNAAASRFELVKDGQIVFGDYQRQPGRLVITHVVTPQTLRGQGLAAVLMQGIFDHTQSAGLELVPVCSYAQVWLKRRGVG